MKKIFSILLVLILVFSGFAAMNLFTIDRSTILAKENENNDSDGKKPEEKPEEKPEKPEEKPGKPEENPNEKPGKPGKDPDTNQKPDKETKPDKDSKPNEKPNSEKESKPNKNPKPNTSSSNSNKSGETSKNNNASPSKSQPSQRHQPSSEQTPTTTSVQQEPSYTEPIEVPVDELDEEPTEEEEIDEEDEEEETEDEDEKYSIEKLKQIDTMIRQEDGKFYVIYKDEDDRVVKQEITKEEAIELGYIDNERAEKEDEQLADIALMSNNSNGKLKRIFGMVAATSVSIGLIAGTYIYYRRKIA